MNLNQGQPGMGGNVVQATNRNPKVGSRALEIMSSLMGADLRKQQMDYQHSLNLDRDTHREAAKAMGHIVRGRADNMLQQENLQFHLNLPDEQRQNIPRTMRTGSTSYDYGSDYVQGLKDLQEQKAKDAADLLKQRQDSVKEKKNTNTPGNKGGKRKPKVKQPGTSFKDVVAQRGMFVHDDEAAGHNKAYDALVQRAQNGDERAQARLAKMPKLGSGYKGGLKGEMARRDAEEKARSVKKTKKTPNNVKPAGGNTKPNAAANKAFDEKAKSMDRTISVDNEGTASVKPNSPKPPKPPKPPKVGS